MYNVYLSGGGLKGAYQYGFFKELYLRCPAFPIKRVYAVSVGAINSAPIVTKKIQALDQFWSNESGVHPFDAIVNDWSDSTTASARLYSFFKHGSVFKNMKHKPYEDFFDSISADEWKMIREKLFIISYCKKTKTPQITGNCTTPRQVIGAIAASARFPGLFDARDQDEIDGIFGTRNVDEVLKRHPDEKWLCLDVQSENKKKGQSQPANARIYQPIVCSIPYISQASSVLSNRCLLDHLIANGRDDARDFLQGAKF